MLNNIRQIRIEKVKKLKELGISPYVSARANTFRTHEISTITENFDKHEKKHVTVVGKIVLLRNLGKIAFMTIQDESGKIQLFLKGDDIIESDEKLSNKALSFKNAKLLDIGDFIQATGTIGKTKTGEISVMVESFTILTKSIRPMPEKFHGLQDKELKLRKRYLELINDAKLRELFRKKSRFWKSIREFMIKEGFMEVVTPILEETPGGADASAFTTHHNALHQDFYLRISPELHLKRVIGGGYEKVFEIGPLFRNEGIDDEHLQEFWNMEFYWAYANVEDNMELNIRLYRHIAMEVLGTTKFSSHGHEVDLADEWARIDYVGYIKEKLGVDVVNDSEDDMRAVLRKKNVKFEDDATRARLADILWKQIRGDIAGPAFLINEPTIVSPLARINDENPDITERFHIIIAGSELGNGYTELIDPVDQLQRFEKQQAMRDAGDDEAQMIDHDFVEMLEYGTPPMTGFGMGERFFSFLVDKPMRQTVFFPQMGRKKE